MKAHWSWLLLLTIAPLFSEVACSDEEPGWVATPTAKSASAMREAMVRDQIEARGIQDPRVLDAILVTAASPKIPEPLEQQLAVGGRMVIPIGEGTQDLRVVERTETGFDERATIPVRFVPMVGKARE